MRRRDVQSKRWRPVVERRLRRWLTVALAGPHGAAARRANGVAIVKLDRLGDFVLALGAVRRLLAHFGPDSLLVISAVAEPLAAREFPEVPRIVMPASRGHGSMWAIARQFRREL